MKYIEGVDLLFPSLSSNREDVNIKYRLPRQVTVIDKKTGLNITTFTPLQQEVPPPCCYITFDLP